MASFSRATKQKGEEESETPRGKRGISPSPGSSVYKMNGLVKVVMISSKKFFNLHLYLIYTEERTQLRGVGVGEWRMEGEQGGGEERESGPYENRIPPDPGSCPSWQGRRGLARIRWTRVLKMCSSCLLG